MYHTFRDCKRGDIAEGVVGGEKDVFASLTSRHRLSLSLVVFCVNTKSSMRRENIRSPSCKTRTSFLCVCVPQVWMRVSRGWTSRESRNHEEEQECSHSVAEQRKASAAEKNNNSTNPTIYIYVPKCFQTAAVEVRCTSQCAQLS